MTPIWNWSVRLARVGETSIRAHWFLIALAVIEFVRWNRFGDAAYGLGLVGTVYACVMLHELAHCIAARRCRLKPGEVVLGPLGSLSVVGHGRTPPQEIFVALAGPLVNLMFASLFVSLCALLGLSLDERVLDPFTGWDQYHLALIKINLILAVLHLAIPAYPMDGGRIFNGLLSLWMNPYQAILISSTVAMLLAGGLCAWGAMNIQPLPILIAAFILFQTAVTRRAAKTSEILDYAEGEYSGNHYRHDQPGFFARWRMRREARLRQKREQERREMREQVDQILDKVNRVGLAGLTTAERNRLEAASRIMRDLQE
jgi:Zn-dependent protease